MLQSIYPWATSCSKLKQALLPTPYAYMPQRIAFMPAKHHELQKTTGPGSVQKGWKGILTCNSNGPQWIRTVRPHQGQRHSTDINGTPIHTQSHTRKTMRLRQMRTKNEAPNPIHRGCRASLRNGQAKQNQQSVHLYFQSTTNQNKAKGSYYQRPAYNQSQDAVWGLHQGQAV